MRLVADTPITIIPPNLMAEVDRAANPTAMRPWIGKPTLEHILPADTDGIPTSLIVFSCKDAERQIKGLVTYEDQMHIEIFLMDIDDNIEDVAAMLNDSDSKKLLWSNGYKRRQERDNCNEPKFMQFSSKRVWNLETWCKRNTKDFKHLEYPRDSATKNYIKTMDIHFIAKYENLRSGRKGKIFDAPWSRHLTRFFEWEPETMNHDLTRLLTLYPMVTKFDLTPTPEQHYLSEQNRKENQRILSERKEFKKKMIQCYQRK